MLLFEQQRSSSRGAIRKMTVQQATDALSHCKTQLQDAQTDRDALMQARASMIALDDRHWGRNSRINEQIRERTDRIGWLDWLCNEYERHVQRAQTGKKQESTGRPSVGDKLKDPRTYPTMSVKEAAQSLSKSESTVYRYVENKKLRSARVPGRILTESVKRLLRPRPNNE